MRLSKARKETLKDHQGIKPSKEHLAVTRAMRKKENQVIYNFVSPEKVLVNPKKVKSARRDRNPLPGLKRMHAETNKYKPNGELR